MKKTINTLITAVILTTAAAIGPNSTNALSETNAPMPNTTRNTTPLYGPPSVFTTKVTGPDSETSLPDIILPPVTTITTQETSVPLYGPPSVFYKKADVDGNGTVNIADYCRMLNAANGYGDYSDNDISDLNRNNKVDELDIKALQNYLFGKTDSVIPIYEEEQPQPEYGCFMTFEKDEVK